MPENLLFVRRMPDAILRQAHVDPNDLSAVIDELRAVPGGVAESPFAADAAETLEKAVERANEKARVDVPDGQSEAIHWALERMMADNQELSTGLHDLRDVVAP
jgi:hypothetical protein